MEDLKYYGIENIDESNLHSLVPEGKVAMKVLKLSEQIMKELQQEKEYHEIEVSDCELIKDSWSVVMTG